MNTETKTCSTCKKTKSVELFAKEKKLKDGTQTYKHKCKSCVNQAYREKNKNKEGSIHEEASRLRNKAKLSLSELKEVEKEKLNNGYKWVYEEVITAKNVKTRQRVLRKVNK